MPLILARYMSRWSNVQRETSTRCLKHCNYWWGTCYSCCRCWGLNQHSTTYLSNIKPWRYNILTLNYFLQGRCRGTFALDVDNITAISLKKRWRYVQRLLLRWLQEYLFTQQMGFAYSRHPTRWCCLSFWFRSSQRPLAPRAGWKGQDQRIQVVDVRVEQTIQRCLITYVINV